MAGSSQSPAKRKKTKPKIENESYTVEVKDWALKYSFGLNLAPKILTGAFMESLHLEIQGLLLQPEKYAGQDIKVTFVGDRRLAAKIDEEPSPEWQPKGVGSIMLRGETREFLGFLPFDTLPIIDGLLAAQRIRFISLNGSALFRGEASVKYVHFLQTYDPDEE